MKNWERNWENNCKLVFLKNLIMEIKLIKTEEEYENALVRLESIFDAPTNSVESDDAESLVQLIENYEEKHYPIEV